MNFNQSLSWYAFSCHLTLRFNYNNAANQRKTSMNELNNEAQKELPLSHMLKSYDLKDIYAALCEQNHDKLNEIQNMIEDILEEIEKNTESLSMIDKILNTMNQMSLSELCKIKVKVNNLLEYI